MNKYPILVSIVIISLVSVAHGAIDDNIKGCWTFDSDATDYYSTYNGAVTGATHVTTGCLLGGGCYDFDGSGDFILFSALSLDTQLTATNVGSMVCWGKTDDLAQATQWIYSSNNAYMLGFRHRGGATDDMTIYGDGSGRGTISLEAPTTWTMYSVTMDGSNAKMYVGATLKSTSSYSGDIGDGVMGVSQPISAAGAQSWDGLIDECRFYDRGLTQTDITYLYNSGAGVTCAPPPTNTCTYSGSGDWNINCADNCNITSATDMNTGDIILYGTGQLNVNANVNCDELYLSKTCSVYLNKNNNINFAKA